MLSSTPVSYSPTLSSKPPSSFAAFLETPQRQSTDSALHFADAVLNHKAGADFAEKFHAIEVDPEDRNKDLTEPVCFRSLFSPSRDCRADRLFRSQYEIEGWTGFNFPGRKGVHSKMDWHHYHFTGVDWDNKNGKKAIFKIQGDGKDWAEDVDGEKGSFDYLMFSDIDHDHPEVRFVCRVPSIRRLTLDSLSQVIKDIIDWGVWLVEETGVAGFRFDACKHFSSHFLRDFVRQVSIRSAPFARLGADFATVSFTGP